jgi:hypothetical protein
VPTKAHFFYTMFCGGLAREGVHPTLGQRLPAGFSCFMVFVCDCCQRFHLVVGACVKKLDDAWHACTGNILCIRAGGYPFVFGLSAFKAENKARVLPLHIKKNEV